MAKIWTIEGEAGKALDATARELETLKIDLSSCRLSMGNLAPQLFTCQQRIDAIDLTGETVPEQGQEVSLWHDAGTNTRAFVGTLVRRRAAHGSGGSSMRWRVAGPDWWLRKVMLTGESADQAGDSTNRTEFKIAEGTVGAGVTAILNRAITLGLTQIAVGTIDAGYKIPSQTLPNKSCWDALAEVMRMMPDAIAWIDYSVVGTPTFNVTRRGSASVITYAVGTANLQDIAAESQFELKVTGVDLKHVERDSKRRTRYREQLSGHAGTAQSGAPNTSNWSGTASVIGSSGTATDLKKTGTVAAIAYAKANASSATANSVNLSGHTAITALTGTLLNVVSGPGSGYPARKITLASGSGYQVDRDWEETPTTDSVIVVGEDVVNITTDAADCVGFWIKITGGTGKGQERIIVEKDDFYDGAIVDEPWDEDEHPDDTSTFDIIAKNRLDGGGSGDDDHLGQLVSLVSGTGAGQTRECIGGEGGEQTVTPNWDTPPDGTTGFSIGPKNEIELAAGHADMVGQGIEIDGGTGLGQHRIITAISGTRATVDRNWTTVPDATSTYAIGPRVVKLAAAASDSDGAYAGLSIEVESQTKTIKHYNGATKEALVDSNFSTNPSASSTYTVGSGSPSFDKQVLSISGPELDSFLPKDEFESEVVTTARCMAGTADLVDPRALIRFDSFVARVNEQFPPVDGLEIAPIDGTYTPPGSGPSGSIESVRPRAKMPAGGARPKGFSYMLVSGAQRDWWEDLGFLVLRVRVKGHYRHRKTPKYVTKPDWILELATSSNTTYLSDSTSEEWWYEADFEFDVVNGLLEGQKLYRPEDYSFLNPPEGLAGNLAAAQDFEPITGRAVLQEDSDAYPDHSKKVVNVTGGPTEWSTMKAMISTVDYSLGTGRFELNLGPPERFDFRDLVARLRRSSSDNIVAL